MQAYFQNFNYSLANEDSSVEAKFSENARHLLAVCGSGSRVIPLLTPNTERVCVVDISPTQLLYFKLKQELIRQIDVDDYLKFLGYVKTPPDYRRKLLGQIRLSSELSEFASAEAALEKGLIYCGQWETKILNMSRRIRKILRFDFDIFFEAKTLEEQKQIFRRHWPRRRLGLLVRLFANQSSLNRKVYGGGFPQDSDETLSDLLIRNFETFFSRKKATTSFFHQLLFLGELRYQDGFPLETHPEVLMNFRSSAAQFEILHMDLIESLRRKNVDFISLSDVPTYLDERNLQALQKALRAQFEAGARAAVFRSFLRHPNVSIPGVDGDKVDRWMDSTGLYEICVFRRKN